MPRVERDSYIALSKIRVLPNWALPLKSHLLRGLRHRAVDRGVDADVVQWPGDNGDDDSSHLGTAGVRSTEVPSLHRGYHPDDQPHQDDHCYHRGYPVPHDRHDPASSLALTRQSPWYDSSRRLRGACISTQSGLLRPLDQPKCQVLVRLRPLCDLPLPLRVEREHLPELGV